MDKEIIVNRAKQMLVANAQQYTRATLPGWLPGQDNKHDRLYKVFGLPEQLTFQAKKNLYDRNGFVKGAIDKLCGKVWQDNPEIIEGSGEEAKDRKETTTEKEFAAFAKRTKLWRCFAMADKSSITPEVLRQLLSYNPVSGKLFWLRRNGDEKATKIFNALFAGKEAFTYRMGKKHLQGRILRHGFLAHRVAWAIYHGEWPKGQIDHINGIQTDNRIENLRVVTSRENSCNSKIHRAGHLPGTTYNKKEGKWKAQVTENSKRICIGRFGTAIEAHKAYMDRVSVLRELSE